MLTTRRKDVKVKLFDRRNLSYTTDTLEIHDLWRLADVKGVLFRTLDKQELVIKRR